MPTIRYVDGEAVSVERPEGSIHLRVTLRDDLCVISARIKRVFPLSLPNEYLSIQDAKGDEVAILRGLSSVMARDRELIDEELDRTYFTPVIERIDRLKQEAGMWHFVVQTQRGPGDFYVRNWRDSAHEIAPRRWHIASVDGARFEIADIESLDGNSKRLLDQLL